MNNMKILRLLLLCVCSLSLNITITDNKKTFYKILYKKYKNYAIDLTLNDNYDFGKNFTVIMKFL